MILSTEHARRYVAYRERFLTGPLGTYDGFPETPDPCPGDMAENLRRYKKDNHAPFMIVSPDPLSKPGTFLHCDYMKVDLESNPHNLEQAKIKKLKFGDNTVYASIALVNFASEYVVTGLVESLEISFGIVKSFQRLGSHKNGFGESGSGPFGFILRADSADWADIEENFCGYGGGEGPSAFNLPPSMDQYAAILSCLAYTKTLLQEAPRIPDHDALRNSLIQAIEERTETIVKFLAFKTFYSIRWEAGGTIKQTAEDRGPFCHHFAYPFARIAGRVLRDDSGDYSEFLGDLQFALVADILPILIDALAKFYKEQLTEWLFGIWERLVRNTLGEQAEAAIEKFFDLPGIILEMFNEHVLEPLIEKIIEPVLQNIGNWNGIAGSQVINLLLAQQIFDLFVAGTLLDTSDSTIFEDSKLVLSVKELLELVGNIEFPDSIDVDVDIDLAPSKPNWWNETILGPWPSPSWHFDIASLSIPVNEMIEVRISVPATGLLRKLAALHEPQAYLPLHAFHMLSSAEVFEDVPNVTSVGIAHKHRNAWFMALAHRFHGESSDDHRVRSTLALLETAPDSFPKGRGTGRWNQDFRWIRETQVKNEPELYSGLDYMAPLMVASSVSIDLAHNRKVLLDTLAPKNDEREDTMGPFKLPFQGPISQKMVLDLMVGGTQSDTIAYVSVVFDRSVGTAKVVLEVPTLSGETKEIEFKQEERVSRVIAVPLTENGVKIKEASANAKGYILLSTND